MVKNGTKYCIFRPKLPPLLLSAGLHQKPNKCHSQKFHTKVHTKYEGKFLFIISNFAQALAAFALKNSS